MNRRDFVAAVAVAALAPPVLAAHAPDLPCPFCGSTDTELLGRVVAGVDASVDQPLLQRTSILDKRLVECANCHLLRALPGGK